MSTPSYPGMVAFDYPKTLPSDQIIPLEVARRLVRESAIPSDGRDQHAEAADARALGDYVALYGDPTTWPEGWQESRDVVPWGYVQQVFPEEVTPYGQQIVIGTWENDA